jgi:hypothetical protein
VRGLARAWRKAIKSSPSGAAISGWALASFPTAPTSPAPSQSLNILGFVVGFGGFSQSPQIRKHLPGPNGRIFGN